MNRSRPRAYARWVARMLRRAAEEAGESPYQILEWALADLSETERGKTLLTVLALELARWLRTDESERKKPMIH